MAAAQTTIHHGPADAMPSTTSPGLQFLKTFLPLLDSLRPEEVQSITQHLTPDATFAINGGAPVPTEQVVGMLTARGEKLSRFGHEVHVAWDIETGNAGKSRTVMYESTSGTVFREDGEGVEVKVREFNVVELVKEGEGGWKARELRTFMDASPVYKHAQKVLPKTE